MNISVLISPCRPDEGASMNPRENPRHFGSQRRVQCHPFRALLLGAWLAGTLAACGGKTSSPPIDSGESHFLDSCVTSCSDGFECIAGVCTQSCSKDTDACSALTPGAVCVEEGTATSRVGRCELPCVSRASCSGLGDGFVCENELCREGQGTAALPTAFESLELRLLSNSAPDAAEDSPIRGCEFRLRLKVTLISNDFIWGECVDSSNVITTEPLDPNDFERVQSVYQSLQVSSESSCTDARRLTLDVRTDEGVKAYADDTHAACASPELEGREFVTGLEDLYDVLNGLRR
jgi:hypothetical protein